MHNTLVIRSSLYKVGRRVYPLVFPCVHLVWHFLWVPGWPTEAQRVLLTGSRGQARHLPVVVGRPGMGNCLASFSLARRLLAPKVQGPCGRQLNFKWRNPWVPHCTRCSFKERGRTAARQCGERLAGVTVDDWQHHLAD